jgi:hypothetical protein
MSTEILTKQITSKVSSSEPDDVPIKNKIPKCYKSYLQVKYGKSDKYYLIKNGLQDESSDDDY